MTWHEAAPPAEERLPAAPVIVTLIRKREKKIVVLSPCGVVIEPT